MRKEKSNMVLELYIMTAKLGKSNCRNEAIAEAFHYMHIVEAWGTGLPRIINRCKEYGLPEPLFEEFEDGFKVTMFRNIRNGNLCDKDATNQANQSNQSDKVSADNTDIVNAI